MLSASAASEPPTPNFAGEKPQPFVNVEPPTANFASEKPQPLANVGRRIQRCENAMPHRHGVVEPRTPAFASVRRPLNASAEKRIPASANEKPPRPGSVDSQIRRRSSARRPLEVRVVVRIRACANEKPKPNVVVSKRIRRPFGRASDRPRRGSASEAAPTPGSSGNFFLPYNSWHTNKGLFLAILKRCPAARVDQWACEKAMAL